jgi:hypothetical protein
MRQVYDYSLTNACRQFGVVVPVHPATGGRSELCPHVRRFQVHGVISRACLFPLMRKERTIAWRRSIEDPAGVESQRLDLHLGLILRNARFPSPILTFYQRHHEDIAKVNASGPLEVGMAEARHHIVPKVVARTVLPLIVVSLSVPVGFRKSTRVRTQLHQSKRRHSSGKRVSAPAGANDGPHIVASWSGIFPARGVVSSAAASFARAKTTAGANEPAAAAAHAFRNSRLRNRRISWFIANTLAAGCSIHLV